MGHVTYFFKFWDPACKLDTAGPNEKDANLGQKVREGVT